MLPGMIRPMDHTNVSKLVAKHLQFRELRTCYSIMSSLTMYKAPSNLRALLPIWDRAIMKSEDENYFPQDIAVVLGKA